MDEKSADSIESETHKSNKDLAKALDHIRAALRGLQFFEIKVILQDGVVVQIEKNKGVRFILQAASAADPGGVARIPIPTRLTFALARRRRRRVPRVAPHAARRPSRFPFAVD